MTPLLPPQHLNLLTFETVREWNVLFCISEFLRKYFTLSVYVLAVSEEAKNIVFCNKRSAMSQKGWSLQLLTERVLLCAQREVLCCITHDFSLLSTQREASLCLSLYAVI